MLVSHDSDEIPKNKYILREKGFVWVQGLQPGIGCKRKVCLSSESPACDWLAPSLWAWDRLNNGTVEDMAVVHLIENTAHLSRALPQ